MGVTAKSGTYIKDFKHWKCIHRIKITSGYNIMSKGVQLFLIFITYILKTELEQKWLDMAFQDIALH